MVTIIMKILLEKVNSYFGDEHATLLSEMLLDSVESYF